MSKKFNDKIFDFIFGKLPYRVNRYIRQNGYKRIESITIYRTPIMPVISKLFNILSFGKFDEMKNKLTYDDVYHLYIVVKLSDDTYCQIEKNQDIYVGDVRTNLGNSEKIEVDMKGRYPSLDQFLNNGKKYMGDKFYKYDAFNKNGGGNCQDFVFNLLVSNGIMTNQYRDFIIQNVDDLLKTLPAYTQLISSTTTKNASYINRFLQSIGLKGFSEGGLVY
jgi:hypothetical protein